MRRRFTRRTWARSVILIEKEKRLGGVCLNRGCIPSKALLYATHQIVNSRESAHRGITFAEPKVELDKLRAWKEAILAKLSGGVATLAKMRGVQVIAGRGYFEGSNKLRVETENGQQFIEYEQAILAVGSMPAMPKAFDLGNPRVMTSTEALEIEDIPENLLVVGGGYIGMEIGTVYAALGSKITLVEALDAILAGADADLARPVVANAKKLFKEIRLKAKVTKMATVGKQIKVESEYNGEKFTELYDRVLVSVGRVPNSKDLGLENTKVELDERGFVKVNPQQQTSDPSDLRHRRHRGRHPARAQGAQGSAHCRGKHPRRNQRVRQRDSRRRFHRSRTRVVRLDGNRGEGKRHEIRSREISVDGFRPRADVRPHGRRDENHR